MAFLVMLCWLFVPAMMSGLLPSLGPDLFMLAWWLLLIPFSFVAVCVHK